MGGFSEGDSATFSARFVHTRNQSMNNIIENHNWRDLAGNF